MTPRQNISTTIAWCLLSGELIKELYCLVNMECRRKKLTVLRSQATHLINEYQQGMQVSLTPNKSTVLHARLISIRTALDSVNKV